MTTFNESLLPNESDISHFKEYGWYCSDAVFSDKEIKTALQGMEEFYSGKRDNKLANTLGIANDTHNDKQKIRNNEFVTLQNNNLKQIGWHPVIKQTAQILMDCKAIRLFSDSLISKYPVPTSKNQGIVGWHSDKAYWPTCSSNNLLTFWIPLQDCTIEMGTCSLYKWQSSMASKRATAFFLIQLTKPRRHEAIFK
ncbi:phytanoyl-CoA dioxygenase family protein [Marinomonas sp. GJ51-6]|uniref:phytanoyl-CoA dioxygenase family protein n=1 Tax=Marinomonas sp. GJ51-6 TaxID=2992802 RepID=UPI00293426FD|nr:phytanoyl-CoA dioxygenase family protein [Marinomonas sp. GJ51-6]WOD06184.1 phytanoyl-CoA dioxygenase family protein [Marinomonas sp. GJ51-6]